MQRRSICASIFNRQCACKCLFILTSDKFTLLLVTHIWYVFLIKCNMCLYSCYHASLFCLHLQIFVISRLIILYWSKKWQHRRTLFVSSLNMFCFCSQLIQIGFFSIKANQVYTGIDCFNFLKISILTCVFLSISSGCTSTWIWFPEVILNKYIFLF